VAAKWLVDTHCHLDFNVFNIDRTEVVVRAREAGVIRIVNPGIDLSTSKLALELGTIYPEVCAAVGIHPNELQSLDVFRDGELKELIAHPKVAAVGEIGLDYYWNKAPKDLQTSAFESQLEFAAEAELPVIVHNREASQDTIAILKIWHSGLKSTCPNLAKCPGVLHSFSGKIEEALNVVEMGFLIGITGPVTFKKAIGLQSLVTVLPLESLLVETDAPFLTPHPMRGKRNEPSYVKIITEKIAELRGISYEQVAEATTKNAFRLFHWRELF
jgi:TatD DNase family protein